MATCFRSKSPILPADSATKSRKSRFISRIARAVHPRWICGFRSKPPCASGNCCGGIIRLTPKCAALNRTSKRPMNNNPFEQARIQQLLSSYGPEEPPRLYLDFGDFLSILWRLDCCTEQPRRARYYRRCLHALSKALDI